MKKQMVFLVLVLLVFSVSAHALPVLSDPNPQHHFYSDWWNALVKVWDKVNEAIEGAHY